MDIDFSKLSRNYNEVPLKRGEYPEIEDIKYLFLECGLSREETAKICGCTSEKVKIVCRKNNLQKTKEQRAELRKRTNLEKYGVENISQLNSIKEKKEQTCLKNYGVKNPAQSKEVYNKIKETCLERYGVESSNSTETKKQKIRNTLLDRYGIDNVMKVFTIKDNENVYEENFKEILLTEEALQIKQKIIDNIPNMIIKIIETKRKNNSFNTSSIEDKLYKLLAKKFTVERQYKSIDYPFCCDFYLVELNLYIEYNGTWTHGGFPYEDNMMCDKQLKRWQSKSAESKFYENAIETWTVRDVIKRQIAKENNLNWLEFFNMEDFMEWYNSICETLN